MEKLTLPDGDESFELTSLVAAEPTRIVLFAVGGGGDPTRHLPLLTALVERGCTVIAPHFERLVSPSPSADDLLMRARRLKIALDLLVPKGMPVAGVGHSIGTTMLLALAGGKVWMRAGQMLPIVPDSRMEKLVLLAPATGFFQAPGALDEVQIPILAWAGTNDPITPPEQAQMLKDVMGSRIPVEIIITDEAGHFSFIHQPPPQVPEPLADREAFLAELTDKVCRFILL